MIYQPHDGTLLSHIPSEPHVNVEFPFNDVATGQVKLVTVETPEVDVVYASVVAGKLSHLTTRKYERNIS